MVMLVHLDEKVLKVYTHRNGWVSMVMIGSNDLVTYDKDMKEFERIPGVITKVPPYESMSYVGTASSAHFLLIFNGPYNLFRIHLAKTEIEEIPEFFAPSDKKFVMPMIAICNAEGTTLAGVSEWDKDYLSISVVLPGQKPLYNRLSIKVKTVSSVAALEMSHNSKNLFIAGSSKDNFQGDGIIQVVSLDKVMKEKQIMLFSDHNQRCVSKITRVPISPSDSTSDSDKFVVGTTRFVHVIQFSNERFTTVSKFAVVDKGRFLFI